MQLSARSINCIIINDKEIKESDIIPKYFCSKDQNIVLILDKNQNNNLENELDIIEHKILNGIPTIVFNTNYDCGYYVNVNQEIDDIEALKIFNIMFGKTYEPLYLTKTTESGIGCNLFKIGDLKCDCIEVKIKKLYEYWEKYKDEFGYAYSDYKIDFGNGLVTIAHEEKVKNIKMGGILMRPIDAEGFSKLEDFLSKISEGFAYFHVPEALNKITIKDYKQQHATNE